MKNNNYLLPASPCPRAIQIKFVTGFLIWFDSYLSKDPFSRVACETLATTNKVVLAGETRGPKIDKDELISKCEEMH